MENFSIKNVSNVRPSKFKNDEVSLVTLTTKGNHLLSPAAAKALGVNKGDYVAVGENGGKLYLYKGYKSEEANVGNKLSFASNPEHGFNFSTANAYGILGGNSESKKVYTVDIENTIEADGVTYFPLNFTREDAKVVKKEKKAASTQEIAASPVTAPTEVQEVVQEVSAGMTAGNVAEEVTSEENNSGMISDEELM